MHIGQIHSFADSQAKRIIDGDVDSFIARFELPLPIYTPYGVSVVMSCDQARCMTVEYFHDVAQQGVHFVEPWSIEMLDQSAHRAMVQIQFAYLDEKRMCLKKTNARYVLRDDPVHPEPLIEMIEFLNLNFNGLSELTQVRPYVH